MAWASPPLPLPPGPQAKRTRHETCDRQPLWLTTEPTLCCHTVAVEHKRGVAIGARCGCPSFVTIIFTPSCGESAENWGDATVAAPAEKAQKGREVFELLGSKLSARWRRSSSRSTCSGTDGPLQRRLVRPSSLRRDLAFKSRLFELLLLEGLLILLVHDVAAGTTGYHQSGANRVLRHFALPQPTKWPPKIQKNEIKSNIGD